MSRFYTSIKNIYPGLIDELNDNLKPLIRTPLVERQFQEASECIICLKRLEKHSAVRDHDHFTGEFRGAAHSTCNLEREVPKKVPIFFHNLRNFDAHLLFSGLTSNTFENITVIPQNIKRFSAIFMDNFIFLDSFMFLP